MHTFHALSLCLRVCKYSLSSDSQLLPHLLDYCICALGFFFSLVADSYYRPLLQSKLIIRFMIEATVVALSADIGPLGLLHD